MTQLFIHMADPSTEFLADIYHNPGGGHIEGATVLRDSLEVDRLNRLITAHDRVVMLGHGSPMGLFDRTFSALSYIISEANASALAGKDNVYIWCHAKDFVARHRLTGFSSGMFISEVSEAMFCGVPVSRRPQEEVTKSNRKFARLVHETILQPSQEIYRHCVENYAMDGHVVDYNRNRLQLFS